MSEVKIIPNSRKLKIIQNKYSCFGTRAANSWPATATIGGRVQLTAPLNLWPALSTVAYPGRKLPLIWPLSEWHWVVFTMARCKQDVNQFNCMYLRYFLFITARFFELKLMYSCSAREVLLTRRGVTEHLGTYLQCV